MNAKKASAAKDQEGPARTSRDQKGPGCCMHGKGLEPCEKVGLLDLKKIYFAIWGFIG